MIEYNQRLFGTLLSDATIDECSNFVHTLFFWRETGVHCLIGELYLIGVLFYVLIDARGIFCLDELEPTNEDMLFL